jgi:hypothetical protein
MSGSEDFFGSITASESSAGSPVASSAVSSENVIVGVIKVPKKSLSREEKDALKRRVGVFVPAQGPVAVTRSGRVVRQPKHFVARPADEDSDDNESVDSSELMDVAEGEAEDIQSEGEEDEDDEKELDEALAVLEKHCGKKRSRDEESDDGSEDYVPSEESESESESSDEESSEEDEESESSDEEESESSDEESSEEESSDDE